MHKLPKYSIIIPVYNGEKTLTRCIESILQQNYSDMELILVNDGSTDTSGSICKTYSSNHVNVTYVEKENGGVSSARNTGLEKATGRFILFVDSDDYVTDNYFTVLEQIDECYDFAMFSHCLTSKKNHEKKISIAFASTDPDECVQEFCNLWCRKSLSSPVTKRYRRSIIQEKNICFPKNLYIGEDKSFILRYIMHCQSCIVSSEVLYFVSLENQDSLSRKIRPDLHFQLETLTALTQKTLREANIPETYRSQYAAAENLIQLRGIYSESKRMHISGKDRKSRRQTIRRMCIDQNRNHLPLPNGIFPALLKIPVRLRMIFIIDWIGRYLAG